MASVSFSTEYEQNDYGGKLPEMREAISRPVRRVSSRRWFLRTAICAGCIPFASCGHHVASTLFPGSLAEFELVTDLPFRTRRIGPSNGRGIVVLHELPGLTKDDLALARALGQSGFNVYVPVLFGSEEQDNVARGYLQACRSELFQCSALSARSRILDTLGPYCDEIARRTNHPIGVVGMCLTGILPLALLAHQVDAAVVCQPTIPFSLRGRPTGDQVYDLGLSAADLKIAQQSAVPFIVVHYDADLRCPAQRMAAIHDRFGQRVATINLAGEGHHSTLGGDFDRTAFDDVVAYLKVRLRMEPGPSDMQLAVLGTDRRRCRIGADRAWHFL